MGIHAGSHTSTLGTMTSARAASAALQNCSSRDIYIVGRRWLFQVTKSSCLHPGTVPTAPALLCSLGLSGRKEQASRVGARTIPQFGPSVLRSPWPQCIRARRCKALKQRHRMGKSTLCSPGMQISSQLHEPTCRSDIRSQKPLHICARQRSRYNRAEWLKQSNVSFQYRRDLYSVLEIFVHLT